MRHGKGIGALVLSLCLLPIVPIWPRPSDNPPEECPALLKQLFFSPAGGRYRLVARDRGHSVDAGEGELRANGEKGRLDFAFSAILPAGKEIRGRVRLDVIRGCRLLLRSEREGEPVIEETVQADPFLARNGILHFYFDQGRRFFQLDRKGKESRMVTEYGLLLLLPGP